ncbi:hypothetical protein EBB07_26845 [Paenibacillaceae bacterium]|nr:hypothetical protein EBB07_26845 [Paenibacillaceae bacterium]
MRGTFSMKFHTTKRISLLLIVGLLCTLLPAGLHAAPANADKFYADKLNQLGLFAGTGSGYELELTPTRLEGLAILIRLLGKEKEAQQLSSNQVPFKDVPKWGAGYVNYAYEHQISQGIDKQRFGAADAMSATQYMTLVLRALGYQDSKGDFTYQEALDKAAAIGLIDDSLRKLLHKKTFLRGHAVQISYQALEQPLNNETSTLAQKLIKDGAITEAAAKSAGLFADANASAGAGSKAANDKTVATFADPGLEQLIRGELKKPTGDIYRSELAAIKMLRGSWPHTRIRSLKGIEQLPNLTSLELQDNLIQDLQPLTALKELKVLGLTRNRIEDIAPLKSLTKLEQLGISDNFIQNIDDLAKLSELTTLIASSNAITSIANLKSLSKLDYLNIKDNAVSDIQVLKQMPQLKNLNLDGNPIVDMSPMKGRTNEGKDSSAIIEQVGRKAQEIIKQTIRPGMTDLQKEEAIHDFLIDHMQYDYQEFSFGTPTVSRPYDVYGALIEQYAVCDGYAHALQMLGRLAGLEIFYIDGHASQPHAWNIIKIDGNFYHVDATWNDNDQLWRDGGPSSAEAHRIYNLMKRAHFNSTHSDRALRISWDFERFPVGKLAVPQPGDKQVKVSINAEIPTNKDLIGWVKLMLEYEVDGVPTTRSAREPFSFRYGQETAEVTLNIPADIPLSSGSVDYWLSYELYENDYTFRVSESTFLHQDIGLTYSPQKNGKLQPDSQLYITLLKVGSKGMTFNQAAAQGKQDKYTLSSAMFGYTETSIENSFPPTNRYTAVNKEAVTLPPYSAIYISELAIGTEFEPTSWKYLFGEHLLAANHSAQARVFKPGELTYTLLPTNEKLKRMANVHFRLSVFDGDFDDQDYQTAASTNKILFQGEWVPAQE